MDSTSTIQVAVARADLLIYQGVTEPSKGRDWYLIVFGNQNGWISSKYSELVP